MAFVRLVDYMGDDSAVVQAARVSYGDGTKTVSDDRALVRYLMRHWHTTPFEMVDFKFHIKCPIFIARQWLRHRTASVNEISARYSIIKNDYYLPEDYRRQTKNNKQGSDELMDNPVLIDYSEALCEHSFVVYENLIDQGVARELARAHLPQCTYTEFYWKINLHNLFHFLKLRMDHHAQKEIRDLAIQMYDLIKPIVPFSCEAFEDFRVNSITLTGPEIHAIVSKTRTIPGKGENIEFQEKLVKLGL